MKKALALLLACLLVFALFAGCGGETEPSTAPSTAPSAAPDDEPSTAPDDEGEEGGEPTDETKTLKVGTVLNETGWFSSFDLNALYEIQTYAALLNEKGGVQIGDDTYMIEIVNADGQSDNDGIRSACIQLVDEGVDFVIETNDFWVSGANDVFEDAGILYACMYVDFDPNFWPETQYAIATCNGAANDLNALLIQCREQYPDAKSLLFVANDDGLQDLKYEYVQGLCDKYGFELLEETVIYSPDNPDMSSIATQVAALQPDAIIGTGVIVNICNLYKEMQNQGCEDMICLASCGKSADTFISLLGEEYANNLISTGQGFDPADNTEEFNELYARIIEEYGEETAANWTGNTVNALYEVLYVMQQVGTTDAAAVLEYWKSAETIPCLYGEGNLGGMETYGLDFNGFNVLPTPISVCKDGVGEFLGWFNYTLD